jgi:flagellin
MGLRINTNVPALTAQRTLEGTSRRLGASYNKLSSGERIYRAGDDAAGLAISEKLKGHIRGLRQARRNANDSISLIQTAEGGLSEATNIIIRMRELAVQAASDTIGDQERGYTDIEFQLLKDEIDRIARSTEFSGRKLLDGTSGPMEFQIGIRNDPVLDRIYYDGSDVDSTITNLALSGETISLKQGAQVALDRLDRALDQIGGARAKLGAIQNRATSIINNLGIYEENLSAANSRIRDVDVAEETSELARNNILFQSGISVLAQANDYTKATLKLLG